MELSKTAAEPMPADDRVSVSHSEPELVPSRYPLKIGDIEVLVVSDGVLSLPGPMLGHNADPGLKRCFYPATNSTGLLMSWW